MDDYQRRKLARKTYYDLNILGWRKRPCGACSGSGRYDHNGSPKCGACKGTGKERYKPTSTEETL